MSTNSSLSSDNHPAGDRACLSRRAFLLRGRLAVSVVTLAGVTGIGLGQAEPAQALLAAYPRRKIGSLAALKPGEPVEFAYPYPTVTNILVRLGARAGGGVGTDEDVVAFNQQCTHMGGPLQGTFKPQHQVFGPCPIHLTTFDLTRHGMVVSGHATESLPQIVLETDGDDLYAVGVLGLLHNYASNLARPNSH